MSERFVPWFGSWPPEFKGDSEGIDMDNDNQSWIHRHFPHIALTIAFIIGLALLLWAGYLKDLWHEVVKGVGIAFISASIIGIALELAFVTRIAKEVFDIAFGYLLPKEIREELKWIYGLKRLAVDYHHDLALERCKDNPSKVIVYETISRTFRNIGNKDEEIKPAFGIQEWFHPEGYSEIISYKLTHNDKEYSLENGGIKVGRPEKNKQSNYILATKEETLESKLKPGDKDKYTFVATCKEIKHKNDDSVSFFETASMNPYVTVKVPDGMDFDVTFANRKQGELEDLGSGHFRLNALLLPGQAIRIRWWNINDSEKQQTIDRRRETKAS